MTYGITIGDSAYSTRAEALAVEVGKWATAGGLAAPEVLDVEAAVGEIRAVGWFDEALGEVEDDELRDAIEAHNAWAREQLGAAAE